MTKMEWLYTHTSEITREDMEEVKVELEELAKTRELDCSEKDIGLYKTSVTGTYKDRSYSEDILPIGVVFKKDGSKQYDYYVSPRLLWEYTGYVYSGKTEN